MSLTGRSSCRVVGLALVVVLAVAVGLPGCSEAPPAESPQEAPPETAAESTPAEPSAESAQEAALPEAEVEATLPDTEVEAALPEAETQSPRTTPQPQLGTSNSAKDARPSTFAPAEDLAGQVPEYIEELEECVASEEGFEDYAERLAKDANTMIVISLALGLHDQDSRYKAVAGGMMRAARDMATAEDFAAARTAVGSLKEAIASGSDPATVLGWEKVASLPELMKKVPLINTTLKGRVRRPERKTEDSRGQCAVLAVIAQGTLANADETIEPEEVEKWQQYSIEMREAAASLNAAYRAMDTEAIRRITIEDLQQSCDRCHAVFAPEQVGAADLEGE